VFLIAFLEGNFIINIITILCISYNVKGKGKMHPCTGTEALYRPYGPQGE